MKGDKTTRYYPSLPPGNTSSELWAYDELKRIASWMQQPVVQTITFDPLTAEPFKPRDGLHAHADGSDWQPNGTGPRGTYYYEEGTGWVQLT